MIRLSTTRSRLLASGLTAAIAMLVAGQSAQAHNHLNCGAYAAAAIAQNDQNKMQGCGFSGPAWQSNFNAHYNWCQGVTMADLTKEDNARKNQLKSCSGSGMQQKCQGYANTALMQQQLNLAKSCGYKGAAWHGNYGVHFNWCMKASNAATAKETNARAGLLSTCN